MSLPGAYCSFCGVAAVHVGRYQLEMDLLFLVELFEGVGCFVVEPVCVGFETPLCEVVVYFLVGFEYFSASAIF